MSDEQRALEYPFLPYHEQLEKAATKLKGRPRHCATNAFRSLRRAWLIAPIDPEIAAFRVITAEEEAASALIAALQRRRYPRANELNLYRHDHKNGLAPFLRAVESMLAEAQVPTPIVRLRVTGDAPRIDIHIPGDALGIPGDRHVTPDEPLNGVLKSGSAGEDGQIVTFDEQLQVLAEGRGAKDILAVIKADANLRNQVLYAGDDGVPNIPNVDAFMVARRRSISLLLSLTIIILQTKAHQLFAVQVLHAYLKALGRVADDKYDYEAAAGPPAALTITVTRSPETAPITIIEQRID